MKMSDVQVGMKFEMFGHHEIVVTEITERGFKYDYDPPFCVHWALGTAVSGEHFGADGEVADESYFQRVNAEARAARLAAGEPY